MVAGRRPRPLPESHRAVPRRPRPTAAAVVLLWSDPDQLSDDAARVVRGIRRLAPDASCSLVTATPTPHLIAVMRGVGAEVRRSADGPAVPALDGADRRYEDWRDWVQGAYGLQVEPATERTLALLASAGDRSTFADQLVDEGLVEQRGQAVRLLRTVTKALAGEEHRHAGLVAREARVLLTGLAEVRPLRWLPAEDVSLLRAAAALRHSPSLAAAAGLTTEDVATLLDLEDLLDDVRVRSTPTVGAPPRSAVREARLWAAGRLALTREATSDSVDELASDILAVATSAARAIARAQAESLTAPQARLAAAIATFEFGGGRLAPEWLEGHDALPSWPGHSPWQLAATTSEVVPFRLCRRLTAELDQRLVDAHALRGARTPQA